MFFRQAMADKLEPESHSKEKTSGKKKDKKQGKVGKGNSPSGDTKGQGNQKLEGATSPVSKTVITEESKDKTQNPKTPQKNPSDASQTDPKKVQKPKGPQKNPNDANQTDPNKPQKTKAELKAERRALQVWL